MTQARLSRSDIKTLTLSSLGGALEFYDFIIFLSFADILQRLFFPADAPLLALIMTYSTYAVAYFVRPLSGILLAHFGDLFGRKNAFMLSLFLMAIPTLLIGLLPTYETAGVIAPLLLLLMRLLQGIALGGEVPSAHVFVTEHLPKQHAGIANSMIASGLTLGVLIGHGVSYLLNHLFTADEILLYAWRLPFLLGGLLGFFTLYLRQYLQETPIFIAMKQARTLSKETPLKRILTEHRRATIVAILTTWLLITGVVLVVLAPGLMRTEFALDPLFVSRVALLATLMNIIGSLLAGILADRLGVLPTTALFALLLGVTSLLFFKSIEGGSERMITLLYCSAALFLGLVSMVPLIIIHLFPAPIRLSGMSFSYNIGNAFFAGMTTLLIPILATLITPMVVAYYILFLSLLALFITLYLRSAKLPSYL